MVAADVTPHAALYAGLIALPFSLLIVRWMMRKPVRGRYR
jgi:hypothetical protein